MGLWAFGISRVHEGKTETSRAFFSFGNHIMLYSSKKALFDTYLSGVRELVLSETGSCTRAFGHKLPSTV
jgi:hypothetical protein